MSQCGARQTLKRKVWAGMCCFCQPLHSSCLPHRNGGRAVARGNSCAFCRSRGQCSLDGGRTFLDIAAWIWMSPPKEAASLCTGYQCLLPPPACLGGSWSNRAGRAEHSMPWKDVTAQLFCLASGFRVPGPSNGSGKGNTDLSGSIHTDF